MGLVLKTVKILVFQDTQEICKDNNHHFTWVEIGDQISKLFFVSIGTREKRKGV